MEDRERFDRSFVIRVIRDFLVALSLVIVFELGARLAIALEDYADNDRERTELAAERLASDVRDIMLNRGGPVAARTVYPILERTYKDVGLEIAIRPSRVTAESIRESYGFEPQGLRSEWSEGDHHEARADLRADEFCITCHTKAEPGDVLGTVVVRRYRHHRLEEWWNEARIAGVIGMGNVIVHTLVLFALLRLRMEPLMNLRSTVSRLARGKLNLTGRVEVKSEDEFGALASDLNEFLDRLTHVLEDLNRVLASVVAVNSRLEAVSDRMTERAEELSTRTRGALRQLLRADSLEGADRLKALEGLGETLVDLARQTSDDRHYLAEMALLEERMQEVTRSGQILLDRISYERVADDEDSSADRGDPSPPDG